jgi:hypothetical protein
MTKILTLATLTIALLALCACGDNGGGSVAFAPTAQRLPVTPEVPMAAAWRNEIMVPNTVDNPLFIQISPDGLDVFTSASIAHSATTALPASGSATFSIVGNAEKWTVVPYSGPGTLPEGPGIVTYPAPINLAVVRTLPLWNSGVEYILLRRSATSVPLTIRCTIAGQSEDYPVVIIPGGG